MTKHKDEITTEEIEKLLKLANSSDAQEVFIETDKITLKVKKKSDTRIDMVNSVLNKNTLPEVPSFNNIKIPDHKEPDKKSSIKAPMIGTFYNAPDPESAPFIKEGDIIKKGQIVCIIEAMKLFNEIEASESGKILKVLVENASPVEFDQPLFEIEQI